MSTKKMSSQHTKKHRDINPVESEGPGTDTVAELFPVKRWSLHNAWNQLLLSSVVCLFVPGLFNAQTGLGGFGSVDPSANSFQNFALYFTFCVSGLTSGLFWNIFKGRAPRIMMGAGALTYGTYSIFAYLSGTQNSSLYNVLWILSAAVLGFGAGWLWTAQGAMMLSYSTKANRGQYINWFWVIFNIGGVLGGIFMFALNFHSEGAGANAGSYFLFIGLMFLGALISAIFLTDPSTVIREDGTKVFIEPRKGFLDEVRDVASVALDKNMVRLFIMFFSSIFFYTYVFNSVNGTLCNIRTRGLSSALFWFSQMIGATIFAKIVDSKFLKSDFNKARAGFLFVVVCGCVGWGLGIYLQYGFRGGFDTGTLSTDQLIDFTQPEYALIVFVMIFYGMTDCAIQVFSYFLMATLAASDARLAGKYVGYYKGIQSLGSAIAWLIDSQYIRATARQQLIVCVALFFASMVTSFFVVQGLSEREEQNEEKKQNILDFDEERRTVANV